MAIFNLPDKDEPEIQMRKRITELEKANKELRAEIIERKQEKHRIKRYNNVLEGINRIFGSVVKAESEKQLAISCLSVAIDVTGSQIGFIGLMGDGGLLHDIAISDLGQAQCLMHEKIGHCSPPGNLVLHGLYGRVIINEKGFFTNDPPDHPDSIGLPEGHPPLISFLGVPLILDGKTAGVVCVANREKGYSFEQQEDLEAIVPAVVQVLQRKREEQKHTLAREALRENEERFRAFVMASSEVVYRVNANWSEMRYLYGRGFLANTESPSSTWLQEYVPPEDQQHVIAVINEAVRTKSTYELEHRVRLADGSTGWIFSRAVPIMDSNGEIIEWFGAASNITKRKKAEAKLNETLDNLEDLVKERTVELQNAYDSLKKSEKSLAEAQEIAHFGNWERDLESNEFYWSDEMYRIFGLKPQESKMNYDTFLSYVHPDDRDYINNAVKEALGGKPLDINFRIILANGEERIAHAKAEVVFDEKNNPVRIVGTTQDITEHKKAEEKIQILANAVESSNDAIITRSLDGVITSWNKGAEQVYGYSAEEVLGNPISILETPALIGESERLSEKIKLGETIQNYETSRLKKNGTIIYVTLTLSPVFDSSGKLIAISAIARDVTESKRAEEKLRESEEKYRNIVETSNEGIYFVNDEGKVTFANKMMETSGYSLDEIIGRPIWNFVPKESLPVAKKEFEKRRKGISGSYELKLIRKDGSDIWVHITAKPFFSKKGKFKGYLAMMADITEPKKSEEKLRESEEKYRNIVEIANEGILVIDAELRITYYNKKIGEMLGYNSEEGIGLPIWGFISEESKASARQHMEKRRQGINENYELELIRKDGSSLWVLINAKSLFDKDGKFKGSISMLTDITKRKAAEEALANIETARKKEIHHRIKNNLQVISSLLDLQAEQFKGSKDIKDSEVLEAFRESQDRVISMALIHEELYRGGGFETLDFSPYIGELAKNLLQTYRIKNIDVSLNMDLEENTFFDMDTAVPLGIIVNELVSNSLKHAFVGRDKGEIWIKLHREENGKGIKNKDYRSTTFFLTVSDNGVGIPENFDIEDLDTLGIQLVTSLVEQLEGELELKRGNGTEFIIKFTVTEKNNQASAAYLHQLIE